MLHTGSSSLRTGFENVLTLQRSEIRNIRQMQFLVFEGVVEVVGLPN